VSVEGGGDDYNYNDDYHDDKKHKSASGVRKYSQTESNIATINTIHTAGNDFPKFL
jgi:hypothetical protein